MYNATVVFKNQDGSINFHFECVIPSLPKAGDFLGIEDPQNRPFKSGLAKIDNVVLVLNPTKLGVFQNQVLIAATILISSEKAITVEAFTL